MRACYSSMLSYFDCMFNYLLFKFRRSQGHLWKKDLDATGDNLSRQNVTNIERHHATSRICRKLFRKAMKNSSIANWKWRYFSSKVILYEFKRKIWKPKTLFHLNLELQGLPHPIKNGHLKLNVFMLSLWTYVLIRLYFQWIKVFLIYISCLL
jgi:hypothetical protein